LDNSSARVQATLDLGAHALLRSSGNLLEFHVDLASGGSWGRPEKLRRVDAGVQEREQRAEVMRSREALQRWVVLAKPSPVCG
jgi:hypothetical protein